MWRWCGSNGQPDPGLNGSANSDGCCIGQCNARSHSNFGSARDADVSAQPVAIGADGHLCPGRAGRR